jgi:hypothetical protein
MRGYSVPSGVFLYRYDNQQVFIMLSVDSFHTVIILYSGDFARKVLPFAMLHISSILNYIKPNGAQHHPHH